MARRGGRSNFVVACAVGILSFACTYDALAEPVNSSPAAQVDTRAVLSQAVITRALAIESPAALVQQLGSFPPGLVPGAQRQDARWLALWSFFFKGSLTKVTFTGQRTHILYLNPIADVGVVSECASSKKSGTVLCRHLCAMPGEFLSGETPARLPSWASVRNPLVAIQARARARLQGFASIYSNTGRALPQLCSQQAQSIAEVRLLDLLLATEGLNAEAFSKAVADYFVSKSPKERALAAKGAPTGDTALAVLSRAPGLSLSAAVPMTQGGWLIFLTPKVTGWDQAAVALKAQTSGALQVQSASVLTY